MEAYMRTLWTPLVRNVLIALFGIYVVQLLGRGVLENYLALQPGAEAQVWRWFTCHILSGPTPTAALFDWLGLFFLLAPNVRDYGRAPLLRAVLLIWLISFGLSLIAVWTGFFAPTMLLGQGAILTMLVVLFATRHPNAQFLLFFVVPVRAIWLVWGTGVFLALMVLYSMSQASFLYLAVWAVSYAWVTLNERGLGLLKLRWKRRQVERKVGRFQVYEGGRGQKTDDWVN